MRIHVLIVAIQSLMLIFLLSFSVYGQDRTTYQIQLTVDGSAKWVIEQTGTDLTSSLETLIEFQNNITSIIDAAKTLTGRNMSAPDDLISISSTVSGSYITVEYAFQWMNFGSVGNHSIVVGDIFEVPNLFDYLFGDGEVHLTYPSQYAIETASPQPKERNESLHTLTWAGTMDFNAGGVNITLAEKSTSPELTDIIGQNGIIIAGLIVVIGASSFTAFVYGRRKKRKAKTTEPEPSGFPGIESDEDKIENLLKSSGGTMYQSAIVEESRFSKAKTSQLLSTLESRGIVSRQKRGRDKIVILAHKEQKK